MPAGVVPIGSKGFASWRATNVRPQAQPGYVVATIRLPLGDMTSLQARALAAEGIWYDAIDDLSRLISADPDIGNDVHLIFQQLSGLAPAIFRQVAILSDIEPKPFIMSMVIGCSGGVVSTVCSIRPSRWRFR